MLIIIFKVMALLAVIIVPLAGPSKKAGSNKIKIDTDIANARYAINDNGNLVELRDRELSHQEH